MKRDDLFAFLDETLSASSFRDYCPNGLQIEGREEVRRVAFGVSVSAALLEEAIAWGADALITHHGIVWNRDTRVMKGARRRRYALALGANLNVAGYHLPLDGHPVFGNNAQIASKLGLGEVAPFCEVDRMAIGVQGRFEQPLSPEEAVRRITEVTGGTPISFLHGPPEVSSIAIVSGDAAGYLENAVDEGLDLYLTGEAKEPTMALAQEHGIHFVAAGHYRTERFGVEALASLLASRFELETQFFLLPNPV